MGIRQAIADIRIMNELFTAAEQEATDLGDEAPGAEHLLLAALALADDSARQTFSTFEVTAADVRAAIVQTHKQALLAVGIDVTGTAEQEQTEALPARTGPYRSTGSLQEVFQRAVALSKARPSRGHTLRSAHVVWAVAELEHGTVSRVLHQLGVTPVDLLQTARKTVAADHEG